MYFILLCKSLKDVKKANSLLHIKYVKKRKEKKKYVNNKDLLYSTGDYTQYFVITYMGKDLKNNRYMCVYA